MLFNTKFILFSIWSIVTFSVCVNFQCPKRSLYIQRERALILTVYTVALFISLLFNIATYFKILDRTIQFFAIFFTFTNFSQEKQLFNPSGHISAILGIARCLLHGHFC